MGWVTRRNWFLQVNVQVLALDRDHACHRIPIGILLFNKIRDENDEGDFSDRRTGYSIPIGKFEKVVLVKV